MRRWRKEKSTVGKVLMRTNFKVRENTFLRMTLSATENAIIDWRQPCKVIFFPFPSLKAGYAILISSVKNTTTSLGKLLQCFLKALLLNVYFRKLAHHIPTKNIMYLEKSRIIDITRWLFFCSYLNKRHSTY